MTEAGLVFRAYRLRLGLTQSELGAALGLHYTTIANWERDAPTRVGTMAMAWLLHTWPGLKPSVARNYARQTKI